ncbi:hypothetical protein M8J75_009883 [Diaphorina citri]|nr:hypothetical protein M8J75_009883 [Diaphorina citri]
MASFVVPGKRSQNDAAFGKFRNTQCTSNSFSALCFANSFSVGLWTGDTMDEILKEGYKLHARCFPRRLNQEFIYLAFADIDKEEDLNSVQVFGEKVFCVPIIDESSLTGRMHEDLDIVVENFFSRYSHGVFTCAVISLALFRDEMGYCIYDPHSCNPVNGENTYSSGVSVAVVYPNISGVIYMLKKKFPDCREYFVICPVLFQIEPNERYSENEVRYDYDVPMVSCEAVVNEGSQLSTETVVVPTVSCEVEIHEDNIALENNMNSTNSSENFPMVSCEILIHEGNNDSEYDMNESNDFLPVESTNYEGMIFDDEGSRCKSLTSDVNDNESGNVSDEGFTVVTNKRKKRKVKVSAAKRAKMIKESVNKIREDNEYKMKERIKDKQHKRQIRENDEYRMQEKSQNVLRKRQYRKNSEIRSNERERDRELKSEARKDPEKRLAERERDRELKSEARKDPEKRAIDRDRNKASMTKTRKDPEKRLVERERERELKIEARKDPEKRAIDRDRNKASMTETRKDPEKRLVERERDRELRSEARKDPEKRAIDRDRNKASMTKARKDPEKRLVERERDRELRSEARKDPEKRAIDRDRNKASMTKARKDPEKRLVERERDRELRSEVRKDPEKRAIDRDRNKASMTKARKDPEKRLVERERDRELRSEARKDSEKRLVERERDRELRSEARKDPEKRAIDRERNNESMKEARKDPKKKEIEKRKKLEYMRKKRETDESYVERENEKRKEDRSAQRDNDILRFRHNLYNQLNNEKNQGDSPSSIYKLKFIESRNKLPGDSEDVYMENVIQKYSKRPKSLENISLVEFAACYHRSYLDLDEVNDDEETEVNRNVKVRSKPAVIRFTKYKLAKDPDNYYRERVLLCLPFRDETKEIESQDCRQLYHNNTDIIRRIEEKFALGAEIDERMEEALEQIGNEEQEDVEENRDERCWSE